MDLDAVSAQYEQDVNEEMVISFLEKGVRDGCFGTRLERITEDELAYLKHMLEEEWKMAQEIEKNPQIKETLPRRNDYITLTYIVYEDLSREIKELEKKRSSPLTKYLNQFLAQVEATQPLHGKVHLNAFLVGEYVRVGDNLVPPCERNGGQIVISLRESFETNIKFVLAHLNDAKISYNELRGRHLAAKWHRI